MGERGRDEGGIEGRLRDKEKRRKTVEMKCEGW